MVAADPRLGSLWSGVSSGKHRGSFFDVVFGLGHVFESKNLMAHNTFPTLIFLIILVNRVSVYPVTFKANAKLFLLEDLK